MRMDSFTYLSVTKFTGSIQLYNKGFNKLNNFEKYVKNLQFKTFILQACAVEKYFLKESTLEIFCRCFRSLFVALLLCKLGNPSHMPKRNFEKIDFSLLSGGR